MMDKQENETEQDFRLRILRSINVANQENFNGNLYHQLKFAYQLLFRFMRLYKVMKILKSSNSS